MPNLYRGYCYPTIDEAALADISNSSSFASVSNGSTVYVGSESSYIVVNTTQVMMEIKGFNFLTGQPIEFTPFYRTYPLCNTVGYYPPQETGFWTSPPTIQQYEDLFAAVLGVIAVSAVFKIIYDMLFSRR